MEQPPKAGGKPPKPPKGTKPPKPEKPPKGKKAPKPPKKGKKLDEMKGVNPAPQKAGGGLAALLVFLVMMLIFAGSVAAVYFDLAGVKEKVLLVLQEGNSPYQNQYDELAERGRQLDARETQAHDLEAQLEERRLELEKRDTQLSNFEQTLLSRQDEIVVREEELDKADNDLKLFVAMLEKMEPAEAAKILGASDIMRITRVLRMMKETVASSILAAMEEGLSQQVAIVMMGQ